MTGTTADHYTANGRDHGFNLFAVPDLGAVLRAGEHGDLDEDTVWTILTGGRPPG